MIENLTHPLYNFKPKYSFKWQPFFANISLLLSARISCLRSKKMSSLLQKQSNDPVSVPIYNLILERSFRRFPCISKIMKLINKASRKQLLDGVVPFTCIGSNPSGEELKKMKKMLSQEEKERKGKKQKKHNRRLKTGEAEQQSKVSADGFPTDYVRVRARRGEATDSHSLAERARREKISMRMNLLQSLVPGCEKITGKAHILDEIIKYVQSLQNQVESLAAKLAFVDLMLYNCEQNPSTNPCVPERICCLEPPMPSVPESSSVQYRSFPEAAPTSPSPLLTEDQRGSLIPQDGGDFLLDMDDQYIEDIVNEPTELDNLCTF